jgi:glycosyltransferase involved in cell wall biosynthesis
MSKAMKGKILYLYAEIMGYTMSTIKELINKGYEIHIVNWDDKKLTPYKYKKVEGVYFYKRSSLSTEELLRFAQEISPQLVVVSGWQDKGYLEVVKILKKAGFIIVTGFDAQWRATIKQRLAKTFKFYLKQYFSYAWVSGVYQYEYARNLGFSKSEIIFNLYSADLGIFNDYYFNHKQSKAVSYPHRFVFVGRFEKVKSIDLLLECWKEMGENKKDWELHLVGQGSLKNTIGDYHGVIIHDFIQPESFDSLIKESGCFILPSKYEPWGVVLHEFTAAGLPIICSNNCGSASTFLINNYNGFHFDADSKVSLKKQMTRIIDSTDEQLNIFSQNSYFISNRITPELSALSLLSIINDDSF